MKIGVLIKQVPDTESQIAIKSDGSGIDESRIKFVMNPYDEIAVEEALCLRDKAGGEVAAVTAGPGRAAESIRQALAMGADRAIHIDASGLSLDSYMTARVLAKACADEEFDIIFAGKIATDDAAGFVHIGVAEVLGIPHISPVEKFVISDDRQHVTATRPVAGGLKDIVESTLPVLIGCEKGLNTPRYATLPGIMKARSKPVKVLQAADLIGDVSPLVNLISLEPPLERKPGRIIGGSISEAAEKLVELLRSEAKVI